MKPMSPTPESLGIGDWASAILWLGFPLFNRRVCAMQGYTAHLILNHTVFLILIYTWFGQAGFWINGKIMARCHSILNNFDVGKSVVSSLKTCCSPRSEPHVPSHMYAYHTPIRVRNYCLSDYPGQMILAWGKFKLCLTCPSGKRKNQCTLVRELLYCLLSAGHSRYHLWE